MPLQIIRNDISKMKVDAIVDSADPKPIAPTGITMAIHQAAGEELMAARKKINKGNLNENDIIVTPGFNLPASYVFHVLSPYRLDGKHGEPEKLYQCYTKILIEATKRRIKSIAIPVLSSGNHLFEAKEALHIALRAITDFLFQEELLVFLVVYGREATAYARKVFGDVKEDIDNEYLDAEKERIGISHIMSRRQYHEKIAQHRLQEIKIKEHASKLENSPQSSQEPFFTIGDYVGNTEPGLYDAIKEFSDRRGQKISALYEFEDHEGKCVITKQLMYDIKHERKQPSKRSVLFLIFALRLNLEDAQYLMGKAGYRLTHSSKADSVVIYMIRDNYYNSEDLNRYLKEYANTNLEHYK